MNMTTPVNRLEKIATVALRKHNSDIEKARPDFLRAVRVEKLVDELANKYLGWVVRREVGHEQFEAQSGSAGLTPPILGSIEVRKHDVRQHRRRTQAEKEAARETMLRSAEAVYDLPVNGRAIGNIRIGELAALKRDLAESWVSVFALSIEDCRNFLLAELIEKHCVVQDTLTPIRNVLDADTLSRFVEQATKEAPRENSEVTHWAAEAIYNYMQTKEIAA
jgi:hypothetical protein